jgi:hypothetical protein
LKPPAAVVAGQWAASSGEAVEFRRHQVEFSQHAVERPVLEHQNDDVGDILERQAFPRFRFG